VQFLRRPQKYIYLKSSFLYKIEIALLPDGDANNASYVF